MKQALSAALVALALFLSLPAFAIADEGASDSLPHIRTTEDGILYSVKEDGAVRIEGYRSTSVKLTLPSQIEGGVVNEIAVAAFFGNSGLIGIVLPDTIEVIGKDAFARCANLTSVVLPSGIASLPSGCFSECGALYDLSLPDSVTEIGDRCFYRCGILGKLVMPAGLERLGIDVFLGCEQLILDCSLSPLAEEYAIAARIPRSFWDTSNAQWLYLGVCVVLLGGAVLIGRALLRRRAEAGEK